MLCYGVSQTLRVSTHVEYNLLFLLSFYNVGIIFWGHSASSMRFFKLQKKIIRIMVGCRSRDSYRKLFIKLKILPLSSLYIFSLLLFVIKNKELFTTNNEIHNIYTRQYLIPAANLTKYQTGLCYMGLKIFNFLPVYIKRESDYPQKF